MHSPENKCDNVKFDKLLPTDFYGWPHLQLRRQCQPFNLTPCEWEEIKVTHREKHDGIRRKPTKKKGFKSLTISTECQMYLDYYFNEYITNLVRRKVVIRKGITSRSLIELKNKLSAASAALSDIANEQEIHYLEKATGAALLDSHKHALIEGSIFPIESISAEWEASSPHKYIAVLLTEAVSKTNSTGISIRNVCNEINNILLLIDQALSEIPKNKQGRIDDPFIALLTGRILAVYQYSGGDDTQTANCWSFISAVIHAYLQHVGGFIDKSILTTLMQVDETVIEKRIGNFLQNYGKAALPEFVNEIKDFCPPEGMFETIGALTHYDVPPINAYPYSDYFKRPGSLHQKLAEMSLWFTQHVQNQSWRRRKPKRRVARIRLRFFLTHSTPSTANASDD